MKVVAAGPARADEFARIHAEAFAIAWSASAFHGSLLGLGAFGLIAEVEGEACGILVGTAVADDAEILTIAVAPEARRRGAARALLAAAHAEARRRGARAILLEVAADNVPARALYGALGYRQAGLRKGYYQAGRAQPHDALVLRFDLDP